MAHTAEKDAPDVRVEYAIHLHAPDESQVYGGTYDSADEAVQAWAYHALVNTNHIVTLVERTVTTTAWET
jgi:hypothetical protein